MVFAWSTPQMFDPFLQLKPFLYIGAILNLCLNSNVELRSHLSGRLTIQHFNLLLSKRLEGHRPLLLGIAANPGHGVVNYTSNCADKEPAEFVEVNPAVLPFQFVPE